MAKDDDMMNPYPDDGVGAMARLFIEPSEEELENTKNLTKDRTMAKDENKITAGRGVGKRPGKHTKAVEIPGVTTGRKRSAIKPKVVQEKEVPPIKSDPFESFRGDLSDIMSVPVSNSWEPYDRFIAWTKNVNKRTTASVEGTTAFLREMTHSTFGDKVGEFEDYLAVQVASEKDLMEFGEEGVALKVDAEEKLRVAIAQDWFDSIKPDAEVDILVGWWNSVRFLTGDVPVSDEIHEAILASIIDGANFSDVVKADYYQRIKDIINKESHYAELFNELQDRISEEAHDHDTYEYTNIASSWYYKMMDIDPEDLDPDMSVVIKVIEEVFEDREDVIEAFHTSISDDAFGAANNPGNEDALPKEDRVPEQLDEDQIEVGDVAFNDDDIADEADKPIKYPNVIKAGDHPSYVRLSGLTNIEAVEATNEWVQLLNEDAIVKEGIEEVTRTLALAKPGSDEHAQLTSDLTELNKHQMLELSDDEIDSRNNSLNNKLLYNGAALMVKGKFSETLMVEKTIKPEKVKNNPTLYFSSLLGVGRPIDLELPTSGFCVSFRFPDREEIDSFIDASTKLDKVIGAVNIDVSDITFENAKVRELIFQLARKLLIGTTLDSKDPISYVRLEDFGLIETAILYSIYPKGLGISLPCSGTGVLSPDERGKTECTVVVRGSITPSTLVYVDPDKITEGARELLDRSENGSVSVEEITALNAKRIPTHVSHVEDGVEIKITLGSPTFTEYNNVAHAVINSAKAKALRLIGKDEELAKKEISTLADSPIKNDVFVTIIESEGNTFTDPISNAENMATIIRNDSALDAYYGAIIEQRESNPIAIGIPKYNCGCGLTRGGADGILPINTLRLFIVAMGIKT